MAASSEKIPIASAGPEDLQQFLPPAYSAVSVKPTATGRLIKAGIAVLIAGALLLLLGAVGAFYFWNNNEKHVYNVHYSMSIGGKVEEGSMEIDSANNRESFSTGSGADEAMEVHDFQIGITGIRFAGGEKCYIKTQVKARLPDVDALNKDSLTFDLEDEVMPAKFDDMIWVAADAPLTDSAFLSTRIKDLCGDLPIFWLRPTYATSEQRKKRTVPRQKRQVEAEEDAGAQVNPENPYQMCKLQQMPGSHLGARDCQCEYLTCNFACLSSRRYICSMPGCGTFEHLHGDKQKGLEGETGSMNIDPMLDHHGICCHECRRSYTHCMRVCEPLGGYHPWPYHYRGCRPVCRIIMPCNWWVARIMGLV